MPPPETFPQFPSPAHYSPHSSHPTDPHSPHNAPDPGSGPDAREGRPGWLTNDNEERSRRNSTPTDNRYTHNNNLQQPTGFSPVSADDSRAWAQNSTQDRNTGNVEVTVQVQGQGPMQVDGQPSTQLDSPHHRPNSYAHPPPLAPGRRSISSPIDSPVIPRLATSDARVPNRLRKNSYRRPRILFYHRHEPHYGFTNFSSHPVVYEGKRYPTSEHLFQSFKFIHRPGLAEHIRTCSPNPSVAFSEARRFAQEVRSDWSQENINVMNTVVYHKFTQHKDLKRELLATGDMELIENSDKDAFWGCGADGKGRNELGKALERLRAQLLETERR